MSAATAFVYNPAAPEFQERMFDVYRTMRDDHPVYRHPDGWYAVTRFADVLAILQDPATFSSETEEAQRIFPLLNFMDPPRHDQLRALVARAFTPKRVADREVRVREIASRLLDELDPRRCDLLHEFAAQLPSIVIGEMIGLPVELLEPFRVCTQVFLPANSAAVMDASATILEMFTDLLAARREEPTDDLMSALLAAEVEGERLTETELLAFCFILVLAGNDTTTSLIANGVELLARHPDQRAELVADPSLIAGAVEEMLRIASPAQALSRTPQRDVVMHGTTIPAGARIMIVFGAANLDDREFADPERFDIHRRITRHLALGHGLHFCLGASLARQEGRVAFEELLRRYSHYELAEPPVRLRSRWARTFESLPAVLEPA